MNPLHPPRIRYTQAFYYFQFPWPISFNAYKHGIHTTKRGRIWRENAVGTVLATCGGRPTALIGRVGLWFEVYPPNDRRKRDLDNTVGKHFWDMLQKAGVLSDDAQVTESHVYRCEKVAKGCVLVHAVEL